MQTGLPKDQSSPPDPPRPTAPARRKRSIRERVDAELRSALVLVIAGEPRRPTKGWHRVASAETRPAGKLPERVIEFAEHGGARERLKAALREAMDRAVDLVFDGVAEQVAREARAA